MIDADEVFSPRDFESFRLLVSFKNTTTGTEVRDPNTVTLSEFDEKSLVLQLPPKSCNVKHHVLVGVYQVTGKEDKITPLVEITGKVRELEDLDAESSRAAIELVQYDEECWKRFLGMYARRQEDILKFLEAARGY